MILKWKILFAGMLVHSSIWAATDVIWIHFQLNHSYADLEISCNSVRTGTSLYFAAEVENGKLTSAVLSNTHWSDARTKSVKLGPDTIKQIEVFQDSKGKYWVKKLPLDGALLKWILFNVPPGTFPQLCLLPQPLKSISVSSVSFEFDPQDIEEFHFATSKNISVTGVRQDGSAYSAKVQLIEQEFQFGKL